MSNGFRLITYINSKLLAENHRVLSVARIVYVRLDSERFRIQTVDWNKDFRPGSGYNKVIAVHETLFVLFSIRTDPI